jgi:radical SAM protein with 4Fe4S-binding SPASM domain
MVNEVPPPVLVSFGITRECDLKCPHCYSDSGEKDPKELSTEEAKGLISDVAELGARLIILDGGEPALRSDLVELTKHAKDVGLRPVLGSNAMSITKELATKLKNVGCEGVAISLDGAEPKSHDEFRGLEGGWQKTVNGAKNCAIAGLPFQIAPLMHRKNWGELPTIIDQSKDLGANAVEIFDFVEAGRGKTHGEYELDTEKRKQAIDMIINLQRKDDITYRVIALPQYWAIVEKTVPEEEILERFVRSCCAAGTRYITILPNGDVIPCMVLQPVLGNVREQSIKDIWYNSPILKTLRNRDNLKGKCGRCKYKLTCVGARCKAFEKTGDIMAEDPTCWLTEDEIRA